MAAGEGRRLRPLTERWPKPVLPVAGKPVIASLLRELSAAGLGPVTVVTGHLAEQVEELVGDGRAFGLELRFVRQPRPDGSADAVKRALDAGASPPIVVSGADKLYRPGDVGAFAAAFEASAWSRTARPSPSGASQRPCSRDSRICQARPTSCWTRSRG